MEGNRNAAPRVMLGEAKRIIAALAPTQSVLSLFAPALRYKDWS